MIAPEVQGPDSSALNDRMAPSIMPRPRTGLGQGLEALVPSLRESSSPIAPFNRQADPPIQWEVAILRSLRRRRCIFTVAPSVLLKEPDRRHIKTNTLTALGALGAAGWELTAVRNGRYYLKRPVARQGE